MSTRFRIGIISSVLWPMAGVIAFKARELLSTRGVTRDFPGKICQIAAFDQKLLQPMSRRFQNGINHFCTLPQSWEHLFPVNALLYREIGRRLHENSLILSMCFSRYRQKFKNRKTSWHCPFYAHAFWYINFVYRFGSLGEKWGVARELLSSMMIPPDHFS